MSTSKQSLPQFALTLLFGIVLLLLSGSMYAQCDFTANPAADICPGTPVALTVNNPQQDHQYTWKFTPGAGLPELKGNNVTVMFPFSAVQRTYQVMLFDTLNGAGVCQKTISMQVKAAPDIALKIAPGSTAGIQLSGNTISLCGSAGSIKLRLLNTTLTAGQNTAYTVDWGDGTTDNYTPAAFTASTPIEHTYAALGGYDIRLTVTHQNGCQYPHVYSFYSGTNPPLSFSSPGATVGLCAPQTLQFLLGGFEGASSATVYKVYLNGALYQQYSQANIKGAIPVAFTQSSCGQGSAAAGNANIFVVGIRAGIPGCPETQIDVKPITVSSAPVAAIQVVRPANQCPNQVWRFTNKSYGAAVITPGSNNTFKCDSTNNAEWSISGVQGVDWEYVSGGAFDNSIQIRFKKAGSYTVRMKTFNFNLTCPAGYDTKETVVTVAEMPTAAAEVQYQQNSNGCLPVKIKMKNNSLLATDYLWTITPAGGFSFDQTNGNRLQEPGITFTKPGTYKIKLEASNNCGAALWETTITVLDIPSLTIKPLSVCQGKPLDILSSQVIFSDNGSAITGWNWTFTGGPAPTNVPLPQGLVFQDAGIFKATATVTNGCGPKTQAVDVTVMDKPKLDVLATFSGPEKCAPVSVTFTQQIAQTGVTYARKVMDAQGNVVALPGPNAQYISGNSNAANATINFKKAGTYRVELTAMNPCDTISSAWEHTFLEKPEAKLPASGPFCKNTEINFSQNLPGLTVTNGGDPAATYKWVFAGGTPDSSTQQYPGLVVFQNNSGSTQTLAISLTVENTCTLASGQGVTTSTNMVLQVPATIIPPDLAPAYCQNHAPIPLPVAPAGVTITGAGVSNGQFNPGANGLLPNTPIVLTYTHSNGVCSAQKMDTVTVLPIPGVPIFQKQSVCLEKDTLSLPAVPMGVWNIATPGALTASGRAVDLQQSKSGVFALTVTVTSANGCQNTSGFALSIQDNFDPSPPDTAFCNVKGLTNLPLNTLSGLQYLGPHVTQPGNLFNPENLPPGAIALPYTMTNSAGCVFLGNITVNIQAPLPPGTVQAGPDQALCSHGNPLTLNGSPSGIWTAFPPTPALHTGGNFVPADAAPGVYRLVLTVGGGNCAAHQTDTAVIRVVGLAPNAGGAEKTCINSPAFTLSAGAGTSAGIRLSWRGVGVTDSLTGLFNPKLAGIGIHKIAVVLTDTASGCAFSVEKNTTVNGLANSKYTIIGLKCAGQELLFENSTSGANTAQWYANNLLFSNEKSTKQSFPAGAQEVSLVSTTSEGCPDTFTLKFTVRELPVASLSATTPTTGCDNMRVDFQTKIMHQDTAWLTVDSAGVQKSMPIQSNLTFRNEGTEVVPYRVILTAKSECATVFDTVLVTVNASPRANYEATYYQPCSGQKVTCSLLSKGNPTGSFYYTSENATPIPANPLTPAVFQWFTDSLPKKIVLYLVSWNACGRDTFAREITVMPKNISALFNIRADTSKLCPGSMVQVRNGSTPGIPVRWETNWGEKFSGDTVDIALPLKPGIYYIKVVAELCGYDTFLMPVRVRANPTATLSTPPPACIGDTIAYKITNSGHGQILYFGDGDSTRQATSSHIYTESGNFKPYLLAYSIEGCTTRVETTAKVFPLPEYAVTLQEQCTVAEGTNLTVVTDPLNTADLEGDKGLYHPALKEGLYHLRVKTPAGCIRDTLVAIREPQALRLWVDTNLIAIPLGTSVQLAARVNDPDATIRWTHGHLLADSTAAVTTASPTEDTRFVVTATALNGCTATTTIFVNVDQQVEVYYPNVFAPEKQGGNEVWYISASPGIQNIRRLQIFARTGDKVFERENFQPNDPTFGWRGETRGKNLNPGVFVFTAELERADGKTEHIEGDITLIR